MSTLRTRSTALFTGFSLLLPIAAGAHGVEGAGTLRPRVTRAPSVSSTLSPQERLVTILGTNDIHGGIEPTLGKDGSQTGGMAFWAGAAQAIRKGLRTQYGDHAGVLVVDAGDQFQGTLISNYTEGQVVFEAMNEVGYDAVVPGNHDYDFGPKGWLDDKVTPTNPDKNPRGALERLVRLAKFPLLSANTYLKDSLVTAEGSAVVVDSVNCAVKTPGATIEWSEAKRPSFLKPYVLKTVAGVRVALIGLDHPTTPHSTTVENVSDLCFRSERDTYLEVQAGLKDEADLFILVIHNGNTNQEFAVSNLVKQVLEARPGSLHAVVAGHTHFINNTEVNGVPIIQSGSGGDMFGRIDFVWDSEKKELRAEKTSRLAGIRMQFDACSSNSRTFCTPVSSSQTRSNVAYEGENVEANPDVNALLARTRAEIDGLAARKLGRAASEIKRDRIMESPLANALTDALRSATGSEIAFMNTGGLREDIAAGEVTYEDLFRVLPFSNHGVTVGPLSASKLVTILTRSAKTCGAYGALMQSGLKVRFQRNCQQAEDGVDPNARLTRVETLAGEVFYDLAQGGLLQPDRTFEVATLDFLAAGGSGYSDFVGVPLVRDYGIVREVLTERFMAQPMTFSPLIDGRWKQEWNPRSGALAPR